MEESVYQKIEAYLGGDMSPEDQRQFEDLMSRDPKLQKEVRLSNEINHHLTENSWLAIADEKTTITRQELKDYIKSDEAETLRSTLKQASSTYKKKNSVSKIRYIISSAAAILVLGLISSVFWNQSPNHNLLYEKYYTETDLPSIVKRGAGNKFLTEGMMAFKAKDYKKSIRFFEDYMNETRDDDPTVYAYIGFSYLEMDKTNEAVLNFDKLLQSNSLDNSRGLWYKSLAYLRTNQIKESKKILAIIISDSLNFNYKKAKELLSDY